MLYEFAGVKVEVRETEKPEDLKDPFGYFVDYDKGIVLEWTDDVEDIKICEHCDEAWDIDEWFHSFDYVEATEKGLGFNYSMTKEEIEHYHGWEVLVCPVCTKKFKEMGLEEVEW